MSPEFPYRAIVHPTDFSEGSDTAFVHALKIAASVRGGGRFTIIHAHSTEAVGTPWGEFPSVRTTLEQWGALPAGSPREDVFNELGVTVEKIEATGPNVVSAVHGYIERHSHDLIVLATRGSEGLPRWIYPSVSERLARLSRIPTLFVPTGGRGFVSADSGAADIQDILIPVAAQPSADAAVRAACALARMLSSAPAQIHLLHVGDDDAEVTPVLDSQFMCRRITCAGPVVDAILTTARELDVAFIAMSTYGHHGFLDALRGSTTEQVVRGAACPVVAAPVTPQSQHVHVPGFESAAIAPSTA